MTKTKPKKRKLFRFTFRMLLLATLVVSLVKFSGTIKGDELPLIIENPFAKQHGRISIKNIDSDGGLPIKNSKFNITNMETGELVDTITTDKYGIATSDLLDMVANTK